MRAREIHASAEELLGQPLNLKRSSVNATLAEHAHMSRLCFERVSHGRYRLASARSPGENRTAAAQRAGRRKHHVAISTWAGCSQSSGGGPQPRSAVSADEGSEGLA